MRISGGIPVGGNLGYFNTDFNIPRLAVPFQITPSLVEDVKDRFAIAQSIPYGAFQQYVRPSSWQDIYDFGTGRISPHSLY
jgi:hypothetical protein